jgi:hypothetical protein
VSIKALQSSLDSLPYHAYDSPANERLPGFFLFPAGWGIDSGLTTLQLSEWPRGQAAATVGAAMPAA